MISRLPFVLSLLAFVAAPLFADDLKPVDLAPIAFNQATLTIVASDGTEVSYTPAELETFPTYTLTTTTPWREVPVKFDGVLLADVLSKNGLDSTATIVVTAENDYQTTFSRALLDTVDILVATRANDKAHSRRDRGPIQFVVGADAFTSSALTSESNFVWMAARIEPAS